MKICNVDNCSNKCVAKGYCAKHYMQLRRNGQINDPFDRICSVDGCKSSLHPKGYCSRHCQQYLLKGVITISNVHNKCTIDGCVNKSRALGLCFALQSIKKKEN